MVLPSTIDASQTLLQNKVTDSETLFKDRFDQFNCQDDLYADLVLGYHGQKHDPCVVGETPPLHSKDP